MPTQSLVVAATMIAASLCSSLCSSLRADVALPSLDLANVRQAWGAPKANKSVQDHPLCVAGTVYSAGLGTHADMTLKIAVNGATRFTAKVGIDDEQRFEDGPNPASVEFLVIGDGKTLFRSGVMRQGEKAKAIDVDLTGVKELTLQASDAGDGNSCDHADWCDAMFVVAAGAAVPTTIAPPPPPPAIRLTPPTAPTPRINGPRVFGARPGSPILIYVPVTGEKPITRAVDALPDGLSFDADHGLITGAINQPGDYVFHVSATNAKGEAKRDWTIHISNEPGTLSPTPIMGWNSWYVWGMGVSEQSMRAAADGLVNSGLIDHGWNYVCIDDGWQVRPGSSEPSFTNDAKLIRDKDGRIVPNRKFPDMKAMVDALHARGLKAGIYSSPGTLTCGGVEGSYGYEAIDANTYADWGYDLLKYDWCSYDRPYDLLRRRQQKAFDVRKEHIAPYALMRDELRKQKRDLVYSLCQYGRQNVWEWGGDVDGQLWRTTGDIADNWSAMSNIGFAQAGHEKYVKPGRFVDPDMLQVGYIHGPNTQLTHLTADEQYTQVSLWSLLAAPLLISCDLTKLDDFTLGLLTNDEVIDINQDALGKQASRVAKDGDLEVWAKPLEDGGVAVGLFNRGEKAASVEATWSDLGLPADASRDVRDVWTQTSLGNHATSFKADVPSHGVKLIKIAGR